MKFEYAYKLMKEEGMKVKLPSWSGYWCWDSDKNTIIMHTKNGDSLDIRETKNVDYTLFNIFSETWIEATPSNTPLLGGSVGMSFDTALVLMKEKGYSMKRQKWDDKVYVVAVQNDEGKSLWKCSEDMFALTLEYVPTQEDMFACDWTYYVKKED